MPQFHYEVRGAEAPDVRSRKTRLVKDGDGAGKPKTSWTILRPTSFMEDLGSDLHGTGFCAMWAAMGGKPLQLVSPRDGGWFGAKALLEGEANPALKDRYLSLAGDELTQARAAEAFRRVHGKAMPKSPGIIGSLVQWSQPELKSMFTCFKEVGSGADVLECGRLAKERGHEVWDFEAWLRQTSRYSCIGIQAMEKQCKIVSGRIWHVSQKLGTEKCLSG